MLALLLVTAAVVVIKSETTLECLEDKMRVTFDSPNSVDAYSLKGSGAGCVPSSSATTIDISLTDCGTSANHNTSHIIYENTLTGSSGAASVISRGALLVLALKCSYEREGTTTVLSWEAGQAVIEIEDEGIFTFNLDVYDTFSSNDFGSELVSPFEIDLRETLYFAITLDAPDALTLSIEIVHIIAMDNSDIESSTNNKYYIVEDGCPEDSTYTALAPTGDNTKRKSFSVEAFNFVSDGTAAVYIHGVVKICDTAEADYAVCSAAPQCSRRKRRSSELAAKDHERTFNVYGGPFLFNEDTDNEGYKSHVSAVIMLLGQTFLLLLNF